ncbi:MAG: phosphonate utilization associated transcriptional regulator [Burkholderiaceae bacterium]|nr:phosphonate utilization associated transcriptional regulator [Burkholderiaceae bacterium]
MRSDAEVAETIELLRSRSLVTAVQQAIESEILSGRIDPGAKLVEAAFAERLGVSRGPVREALRMLEQAGLVRQEKNRGTYVRNLALGEALEIFDLRAMLEESVGRELARRASDDLLKPVRALVDALERAAREERADRYHGLNLEFHDALVRALGNARLAEVYRTLTNELSLFRRRNLAQPRLLAASASEHRGIVEAIASGDVEAAGRAMRAHVEASRERTIRNQGGASPAA